MSGEPDRIGDLADRLFDAARQERPSEGTRRRALAAMEGEHGRARAHRGRYAGLLLVAAIFGCIVWAFARGRDEILLSPDAVTLAKKRVNGESAAMPAAPAQSASNERAVPLADRHAAGSHKAQKTDRVAASLSDEVAALDRARVALSSGDAARALAVLDDYDRVLRGTRLKAEATLLRIEALARAGNRKAAAELAQRFIADNRDNPLADRARAFVHQRLLDSDGLGAADGGSSP